MKIKLIDLMRQLEDNEDFNNLMAMTIIHAGIEEIVEDKELKNKLIKLIEEFVNVEKHEVEVEINLENTGVKK